MNFLEWNNAIGKHFFNPDRIGSRVFFYVTEEVLNEIGAQADADKDDFIAAVKVGPPWNTLQGGICQQALQTLENWRERGLEYPPYLCYLALFVWAGSVDAGFAKHAYYPGLRFLLGEDLQPGMYPSFNKMYHLWDDLAVWSNIDRHGELGMFEANIVGEWLHVGLPKAQTLLTDREREKLPFVFADNGFDPHSPPSEKELAYLLSEDPRNYLRAHTKDLLRSTPGREVARAVLIETVLEVLDQWDCAIPNVGVETRTTGSLMANIRLVMAFDHTARATRFSLRCRSNRTYPEEGLHFTGNDTEALFCYDDWQGWSTPFSRSPSQLLVFDAATLEWHAGFSIVDKEHGWRASLSKRAVRIMVSAKKFGFDGFVEESQLPQDEMFYLLALRDHSEALRTWGKIGCKGFSELHHVLGLPKNWFLFYVERAESDIGIRDLLPFLAFPSELRINLQGGLRVRGSQYFSFALPQIQLTGPREAVSLLCNDIPMKSEVGISLYSIPAELNARRLVIEVRSGDQSIRKKSLYSVEKLAWRDSRPLAKIDKFGGRIVGEAGESCVGPIVHGVTAPPYDVEVFVPSSGNHRTYFIGKNPGEISEYPSEAMPNDWKPIWAVMMKRGKGHAIYCGTEPKSEEPTLLASGNSKHRRVWKEVLWHKRMRISFPFHRTLSALWAKYKDVAKHVR